MTERDKEMAQDAAMTVFACWPDAARDNLAKMFALAREEERKRVANELMHQGNICPCEEDGKVFHSAAWLVRADFSFEDAERLEDEANCVSVAETSDKDHQNQAKPP